LHEVVRTKVILIILDKHLFIWYGLWLFLWFLLVFLPLFRSLDKHLLTWSLLYFFLIFLLRFTIISLGNLLLFLFMYDGVYVSLINPLIFIIINGLNVWLIWLLHYFHLEAIDLLCHDLHWHSKLSWLHDLLWRRRKIQLVDLWLLKLLLDFLRFLSFSHGFLNLLQLRWAYWVKVLFKPRCIFLVDLLIIPLMSNFFVIFLFRISLFEHLVLVFWRLDVIGSHLGDHASDEALHFGRASAVVCRLRQARGLDCTYSGLLEI